MELEKILTDFNSQLLIGAGAIFLILLLIVIYLNSRLSKVEKKYKMLMADTKGGNLEELIITKINDVNQVKKDIDSLDKRYVEMRHKLSLNIQKIGVVRFNSLAEMGGDLSFAIALLDEHENGVVFSSIYAREDARCYAKPIKAGVSEYNLSKEEKEAIANTKN